jgi:hypothetical protein
MIRGFEIGLAKEMGGFICQLHLKREVVLVAE